MLQVAHYGFGSVSLLQNGSSTQRKCSVGAVNDPERWRLSRSIHKLNNITNAVD
jgi:hypothetical protein